jgi:hypothetical protein
VRRVLPVDLGYSRTPGALVKKIRSARSRLFRRSRIAAGLAAVAGLAVTGAHITRVRAPHLSMISAPGVVTQVIVAAAHAAG